MLGAARTVALSSLVVISSAVAACGHVEATPAKTPHGSAKTATAPRPDGGAAPARTSFTDELSQLVDASPRPTAVVVLPLGAEGTFLVQEKDMQAERQSFRPGSTVKPLLAMMAADAGVLLPNAHHTCSGVRNESGLTCFAE